MRAVKEDQLNALNAITDCIDPCIGNIGKHTKLIPPRPAGSDYNRELFNRRTGLSFDPLAAAGRSRYSFVLLFNTSRLNRLVEFQVENNGLGIDDMISVLSSKTWKPRLKGFQKANSAAKRTTSAHLLAASINDEALLLPNLNYLKL
jgi:hypothetical protein